MDNTPPTAYALDDGFDYDSFRFNEAFPVPAAYVVASTMAYFRGPDGNLWFAPDGDPSNSIDWEYPQNVAEFDRRDGTPGDPAAYRKAIDALCAALDALLAADTAYVALFPRDS